MNVLAAAKSPLEFQIPPLPDLEIVVTPMERVLAFLSHPDGALVVAASVVFLIVWALAAVLSRSGGFGVRGVFAQEVRGYRSWVVAFVVHALAIFVLGAYFFLLTRQDWLTNDLDWMYLGPYVAMILADAVLIAVLSERGTRLARISGRLQRLGKGEVQ